ncbi:hypothetical protein DV737_g3939, partial [Chaetothyriales sp. CBS 132003]
MMPSQKKISEIFENVKFTELYKKAERVTSQFAKPMIEQAGLIEYAEQHDRLTVLDTACGTGVVSSLIVSALASSASQAKLRLTCADISKSMIASVQKRIELENWPATAVKADGTDTGLAADQFNFVFCNFGPSLMPSPPKCVTECFRVLLPGGVFGCTSWVYLPWLSEMRECWKAYPAAHRGQELPRFPDDDEFLDTFAVDGHTWRDPDMVKRILEESGFVDVKTTYVSGTSELENYREWVSMLPGSVAMVFNQCWTAAERQAWKDEAEGWIEEWTKNKYGEEQQIRWDWRALVTTGRRPKW